ncbi:MAG TPA: C45 family autoproteolytic acyltransferase/hydrolase [Planctomycetaceae bacterium]|nr:C45 family autoproteolytic acyltransferase/hydrolase [Planctomycetaceae bacterium]
MLEKQSGDGSPHSKGPRTIRIGATDFASLRRLAERAAGSTAQTWESAERAVFSPDHRHRLAIVAASTDELEQKLRLAAAQGERSEARPLLAEKGIFFGELASEPPRVAFLFPGQGSQYDGMLRELVGQFPPARAAMEAVDAVLTRLGLPSFADVAWKEPEQLGRDVWRTQLSLLAADTILAAAVHALGPSPERVAGHSFGELAALIAAGAWTFEDAVRATAERCKAIEACARSAGVMLSTSAPADAIERLLPGVAGRVSISHRNAPDQTVCGGEAAAVRELAALVEREGFKTKILDVPAAFHTSLMEDVREPFGRGLAGIPLEPPRVPLLSSVTNRYVSEPDDIRHNLVVQMTQPVHWTGLIERLASEGINVFVEVGPKQVLTTLAKSILAGRAVTLVGADHPKRPGVAQLLFARAAVETAGALDPRESSMAVRFEASRPARAPGESPAVSASPAEQPSPVLSQVDGCSVLRLAGTPFEMGFAHGRAQAQHIRRIVRRYADLAGTRWDTLRDLETAAANASTYFGPDELEELRGIAKGADVSFESIVAHNLRLYLDAGAGGLHFAVSAGANHGEGLIHAANEDLQMGLCVLDCLARNIQVRHPAEGIPHVAFGVAGQVGTLNGINARGLAVTTSALVDRASDVASASGRLHTVLVKQVLERAEEIDAALEIIRQSRSAATWSLCLSHHAADRICYLECNGPDVRTLPAVPTVMAANHRLLEALPGEPPSPSRARLERLQELLGGERPSSVSAEQARSALRDALDRRRGREVFRPTINTVRRVDNQISIVMQPARGRVWATAGPLANGHQNEFLELKLDELLPQTAAVQPAGAGSGPASVVTAEALADSYRQAREADSQPAGANVCQRCVMRVVEAPLPEAPARLALAGSAVVLGRNAAARALVEELRRSGAHVVAIADAEGPEQAVNALEAAWESAPAPHLFLMTPLDELASASLDADVWSVRRTRGVLTPYRVCQRWYQLCLEFGLLPRATLVGATALGGDFGFSGRVRNVESGALAGLLKAVDMELRLGRRIEGFRAKVIDFASDAAPPAIAAAIVRELAAGDDELEAGYVAGRRYVPRPMVMPLPVGRRSSPSLPVGRSSTPSKRAMDGVELRPAAEGTQLDVPAGGVVIVTGGARGVTAEVARELGRRFDVKLHLIGSSPLPEIPDAYRDLSADELKDVKASLMKEARANGENPLDAWSRFEKALEIDRNLRSFAGAGLKASYHACDISNRAALAKLLDEIRAADGPVHAIIHGAGYERAASFEKKQPELVDRTIAAKVDGAAALMELTRRDPLKYFAAFASVSGRFGGVGQTDYCLANEMLAKLVDWYRTARPECRSAVFHWHAWDDVGMAVRPESKHITKLHNIRFMPAREGTRHLIDELLAGVPEREVVVTELQYCLQKYGVASVGRSSTPSAPMQSVPASSPVPDGVELRPTAPPPLIDAVTDHVPGERLTAEVHLDPTVDVFLVQHQFKGRPMLPAVVSLEAIAQAAQLLAGPGQRIAELRDVELLNGLRFHSDEPQTARVHARVEGGRIEGDFTCDFYNRKGVLLLKDKPYMRAVAELAPASAPLPDADSPSNVPDEWMDCWYFEDGLVIYHGPVFRNLRQINVEGDEGWARLVASPLAELSGRRRPREGWIVPAALLDACFFGCGSYLWIRFDGTVAIPAGIERLVLGRPPRPEENCLLSMRFRGREGQHGLFDCRVTGEDGRMVLHVDGYRNVIVAEEPAHVR